MMMAASVLRLPVVMSRALMGRGLSAPAHPTDLTKVVTLPSSLARLYQNSCDVVPTDGSRVRELGAGAGEMLRCGTGGHQPLESDPRSAEVDTEHELAGDFGVDTSEHPHINLVSDRLQTPRSKLNNTMLSKSSHLITPSKILLASADSLPNTSTSSAESAAMECTASLMIKSHCLNPLRGLYTSQEVPNGTSIQESRDSLLVQHHVFRPTPTRAAAPQQEQHMIASFGQQHEQQRRRRLVLSVPAPVRGGVHRPHPYLRGSVVPPAVHPVVLQHGASYRDVYRHSAIAQEGLLLAAAADRAARTLRQAPAEGHDQVCTQREEEGEEEEHQEMGGEKSNGERLARGTLLDIAACDGPVFFERVLNKAFAGNCLEDIDSDMEINVDELDSTDDSSVLTTTDAATGSQHGRVNTTGTATDSALDTSNEGMEMSTVAVKLAGGSHSRLLHTLSSTYHCVYCNHTFKSHYCYQKHMRRHINPITVEVGPRALMPSLGTPNKTSKEQEEERGLESTPQDLHGVGTDHPTTSHREDCSSSSGIPNIDQLATDGGNEDKKEIVPSTVANRAILTDPNAPAALLLVPSINSDCRQKNLQQPTVPLAAASLRGHSPHYPRRPSPLPVKASLDLNVQYFPCKTCGSKFPSYYFVHKHRRMCHGEENTGVSGGGLDTHSSGNSNHSGGNSNESSANSYYGCGNSSQVGGSIYQSGGNSSHEGGSCNSEDNSNVAAISHAADDVNQSDVISIQSTTKVQASNREGQALKTGDDSNVAAISHAADDVNQSDVISIQSTTKVQASNREGQALKTGDERKSFFTGRNEAKAIIQIENRAVSSSHDEHASEVGWQAEGATSLRHAAECAEDNTGEGRSNTEKDKPGIHKGDGGQCSVKCIGMESSAEGSPDELIQDSEHHGQGGTIGCTATYNGPDNETENYSTLHGTRTKYLVDTTSSLNQKAYSLKPELKCSRSITVTTYSESLTKSA